MNAQWLSARLRATVARLEDDCGADALRELADEIDAESARIDAER